VSAKDHARELLEDAIDRELEERELLELPPPPRFPPDAPVVPNDAWEYRPRPSRCRWLLPHRDEPVRGFPALFRCARCGQLRYTVPSAKW